jgi:hypothetical protein
MGTLQNETRYITHHQNGTDFGTADEKCSTRMVEKISLVIEENESL